VSNITTQLSFAFAVSRRTNKGGTWREGMKNFRLSRSMAVWLADFKHATGRLPAYNALIVLIQNFLNQFFGHSEFYLL
jgi:hypothetical protein